MNEIIVPKLTIIGKIIEVGDCVQNYPGVVIEDSEGNLIKLSLSKDDAKIFGKHYADKVQLNFDASVTFMPNDEHY